MFTNLMVDAGLLVHGAPEARAGDPDQRPPEHRDMSTLRSTARCLGADTDGTSHLSRQAALAGVLSSASKSSIRRFVITEKAPTRAATTAFTFKTLLRHYAKRALTPWPSP